MEIKTSAYCFCLSLKITFFTTVILEQNDIPFHVPSYEYSI